MVVSTLRAIGRDGCGRLWAKFAMRRDYMGALALGRQHKVAINGRIGGHLKGEVEVRELVRHADVCAAGHSTSSSTSRLERMTEASRCRPPTRSSLLHLPRGTCERSYTGELNTIFT